MMFELHALILFSAAYLSILFFCAWAAEKKFIPTYITQHPAVYVLSLGVYASSWSYYGNVGIAHDKGYLFLAFYLGLSGAFLLAPVLLNPILKIVHNNQLRSLADLLAFRFRSPAAGTLSTLLLLITVMPLLSLQIKAVADSVHLISRTSSPEILAIGFCVLIIIFTISFGSRHISNRDYHKGLVFAVAVESLVKLVVMLVLSGILLMHVFGGLDGLNQWLETHSGNITAMNKSLENGPWRTTLLMFFASAIVMPHMFHMAFTENRDKKALHIASWGLPLFLLLLSISTPLILWAGKKLGIDLPPEYFPLAIGQALNIPWLTIIVYLGGLSAASGLMIVTTLALSSMILNHVILPFYPKNDQIYRHINIYRRLIWLRRLLIITIIIAAYGFYLSFKDQRDLYSLSIVAYIGALQLLPGALCTLYWEKANHKGFIAGLLAGSLTWFLTLALTLSLDYKTLFITPWPSAALNLDNWHVVAIASLIINASIFYIVSRSTKIHDCELRAAKACMVQNIKLDVCSVPKANSAIRFQEMLSDRLGKAAAQHEVDKALTELNMPPNEKRPQALAKLRDTIEANLSGLMGPTIGHDIVHSSLPLNSGQRYIAQDIHFIEKRLEAYHWQLTGLTAELDNLRRYHRDTLNSIPIGVCAIDNKDIMFWNNAIANLTGIDASDALGTPVTQLTEPWASLINDFIESNANYKTKSHLEVGGQLRYFNLHKANINAETPNLIGNQVMLLADMTETYMMEEQLVHNERLASIGQLAAGVAHEIGNPITGINCLAQELDALSSDPEIKDNAQKILSQTKRVGNIVQMLVSYAHSDQLKHHGQQINNNENIKIHACVSEAISLLQLNSKNDNLIFENKCNPDHWVKGSYQKLQQVFINLLSNAADASKSGDTITVSSAETTHTVDIDVQDNGPGIPKNIQEKLFDPFFTTKEAGKGTGLGLALSWNIIEEHFGTIRVISPTNKNEQTGTCFIISLPRLESNILEALHGIEHQREIA